MEQNGPFVIAVVSGKGGVGKTTIAANIAYIASQIGQTALVDFDIHNQGATGLFLPLDVIGEECTSTFAMITGRRSGPFARVSESLSFLPSVTPFEKTTQLDIALFLSEEQNRLNVHKFFEHLKSQNDLRFVIIDCHGGIDFLSLEAFLQSDEVLVVTEFDSVTFNGTLELMRFYHENAYKQGTVSSRKDREIKFVVNRVETVHRRLEIIRSLTRSYDTSISGALRYQIVDLIPTEQIIASSFGEYPFFVELAPRAVFSAKLRLICYELLRSLPSVDQNTPTIGAMASEKTRRKTRKMIASYATIMAERFRKSFILSMLGVMIFMLFALSLSTIELWRFGESTLEINRANERVFSLVLMLLYVFFAWFCTHFVFTCFAARRHYIVEYQYSRNLLSRFRGDEYALVRLNALINRIIRAMIWPGVLMFSLIAIVFGISAVLMLVGLILDMNPENLLN